MDNLELLNEITQGVEWYRYGVKRVTGENIYWSNYFDLGLDGYGVLNGVMGTQLPIYIGTYNEFINGGKNAQEQTLFITESGIRLIFKITRMNETTNQMSVNETINMSQEEYDNTTWANVPGYSINYSLRLEKYNFDTQQVERSRTISNSETYNLFVPINNWEIYGSIHDYIRRINYCAIYTNRAESSYYNWITVDSNGYTANLSLVWYDSNKEVRITYTFNNYWTSSSNTPVFVEGTYFAKTLATIPASLFNSTDWFDPEKDGGVKEQNEDNPPWKDDTDDENSKYDGRYGNYPSDDIEFPSLPTTSAIDTGFITLYCPTTTQLQNLVDYLWTSDWIETIKKVINNPMDAVISLQMCPLRNIQYSASQLKIGAVNTGLNSNKCTNQYMIADCGTLKIPHNYASALDYSPNTKISIYLPFIGVRNIDIDLSMNSTLSLKYYCDLLTGNSVAMLQVSKDRTSKSIYYTWDCNINTQVPITGANYSQVITSLMNVGLSAVGGAVSPGVSVATASNIIQNSANVLGGKVGIEQHGSLGCNTGLMATLQPYVMITLPRQSLPSSFAHDKGYISNVTKQLGSISGYTEVDMLHLDGIGGTDAEINEIETLLKQGVIL